MIRLPVPLLAASTKSSRSGGAQQREDQALSAAELRLVAPVDPIRRGHHPKATARHAGVELQLRRPAHRLTALICRQAHGRPEHAATPTARAEKKGPTGGGGRAPTALMRGNLHTHSTLLHTSCSPSGARLLMKLSRDLPSQPQQGDVVSGNFDTSAKLRGCKAQELGVDRGNNGLTYIGNKYGTLRALRLAPTK
jgi:hypothetical protein